MQGAKAGNESILDKLPPKVMKRVEVLKRIQVIFSFPVMCN